MVLGRPRHQVAAPDLGLLLLRQRVGRADLELDLLGRLAADQQLVLLLDVADDRLVELVAADADRLAHDDAAQRDHGDLARAAADVDDHVAGGLGHRQAGADRGRHGLFDQLRPARAGRVGGLFDGALLDPGHARGHADHDPRVGPLVLVHLADEVAQHLLGDLEVGDDAVFERADGADRAGRAAEHALGFGADRVDFAGAVVDSDDGRLGEHDAAAANVDEGVGGAEVDGDVARAEAREEVEETDDLLLSVRRSLILHAAPSGAKRVREAPCPRRSTWRADSRPSSEPPRESG